MNSEGTRVENGVLVCDADRIIRDNVLKLKVRVRVDMSRWLRFRLWVASVLSGLVAVVLGTEFDLVEVEDGDTSDGQVEGVDKAGKGD